ncbi:MAG: PEP-CTERM/exosortase system-associated acyltransferase [Motiliproteus sp.]
MQPEKSNLAQLFRQIYSIRFADTEALRQSSFKLRHDVYCDEKGWEKISDSGLEVDCHDLQAAHCLIQHRQTGEFVGTVRLVEGGHSKDLPCVTHLKQQGVLTADSDQLFSASTGELSRLAIPACYRGGLGQGIVSNDQPAGLNNLLILAGLVLASLAIAELKYLENVLILGETRVRRVLERHGLAIEPVSETIELNGVRRLHCLKMNQFNANFSPEIQGFYQWIKGYLEGIVPSGSCSFSTSSEPRLIRV